MLNQNFVQTFNDVTDYDVNNQITIEKLLELIQSENHKWFNQIKLARQIGKGTDEYDSIKTNLPVITFNFTFNNRRVKDDINKPTGFLYIDVDDSEFDIQSLDESKIFAYWKSLGGNGYSILVQVNGLSFDNFFDIYDTITSELGISNIHDPHARKHNQANVLSHDPNLFHNPNSFIFHFDSDYLSDSKKVSSSRTKKEREGMGPDDTFLGTDEKIRFNNIGDYFTNSNQEYIVFEQKQLISKVFIPHLVIKGNRNTALYTYGCQLIGLNPNISRRLFNYWLNYGNNKLASPLSHKEVVSIGKNIWKKRNNNEIELHGNELRRVLFNPFIDISLSRKQQIIGKVIGELQVEKTLNEMFDIIAEWDFEKMGKITQDKVAELSTRSTATIKRHWKHFKQDIKEVNREFKHLYSKSKKKSKKSSKVVDMTPTKTLSDYSLGDFVDVGEFLNILSTEANIKLDFKFINDFKFALDRSVDSVKNIIITLIKITRENKYQNSMYSHIEVPRGLLVCLQQNKQVLVA